MKYTGAREGYSPAALDKWRRAEDILPWLFRPFRAVPTAQVLAFRAKRREKNRRRRCNLNRRRKQHGRQ